MPILRGSKFTGSQGLPLTKLMAVNTRLAQLRRLRLKFYPSDSFNRKLGNLALARAKSRNGGT